MLSHLHILTVTHRHTALKAVGGYALVPTADMDLAAALQQLRAAFQLSGLFYTATCNRVMYVFTGPKKVDEAFKLRFFQYINTNLAADAIAADVQHYTGGVAVDHFYHVGASLDSLVVGERQILGQMREAYSQCLEAGLIDDDLRLFFQQMVVAAKDIYARTRIGDKAVSIASLAVRKLLSHHLPTQARVLLIGAGQTNNLVAKFLQKHHFSNVTVFNRSLPAAQSLAKKFGSEAQTLAQLPKYTGGFDCIIVCTGATEPLLTAPLYEQLLQGESPEGKIIVDLAIPHNTADELVEQFNPLYIPIESLRQLAEANKAAREVEMQHAITLLQDHLQAFPVLYKERQLERALREIPDAIKAVRQKAVSEVFHKEIATLDENSQQVLHQVMAYMEKKCIGIPMRVARESLLNV